MDVILFIGHHKVGSSALQEFLSQNSMALLRAGILYPAVEPEGLTVLLAKALHGGDKAETLPINAREAHNALAFRMIAEETGGPVPPFHKGLPRSRQMFRTLTQQIALLQPHTVILTAEVFANFAAISTGLIDRLGECFPDANIRVVAIFRRIDDYLASWHGQRLRFNHKLRPLRAGGVPPYKSGIHFDYEKMLEGWITNMPGAEFVLRNYADVLAAGGSVEDFITQSGVAFPPDLLPVRRANPSLHRGLVEIARRGNHQLDAPDAANLRQVLERLAPRLNLPPSRDVELFGAAVRADLVESFGPIHDYLGRVSGQSPFFPDLEQARETRPHDEKDVAATALGQLKHLGDNIRNARLRDFLTALDLEQEI